MERAYKSLRMFENDFLEKLSHVHPITPLIFWSPVIAFLLYRGVGVHGFGARELGLTALAGILVWTLTEYVLHRWVFHYKGSSRLTQRLHFIIHGNHHDVPNDPTRLVMPPAAGVILAALLFVPFRALLGPSWVEPFFAFFLVGYLAYDYTHYAVHHFTPRTRWGKMVKQHHMLHHFTGVEARWGVSSPLWDKVFGTMGPGKR